MTAEAVTFALAQYEAVRAHLEEHYADADCIGIRRGAFNLIWGTVEAKDLHLSVTYLIAGRRIGEVFTRRYRKERMEDCLHLHYAKRR